MVKTLFGIFLLLCSLSIPTYAFPASDNSGTTLAAQDGTGTVWAISSDGTGTLNRWQTGGWAVQTVPGTAGFRLYALTRGENGFVYALWQKLNQGQPQTPECLVTVHRGVYLHLLARFPGTVVRDTFANVPALFAGLAGDIWLAGYQPLLWHISPEGSVSTFPLKPEQFFGGQLLTDYQSQVIQSTVDGAGRRWFWQECPNSYGSNIGLRGVLIWDGKTLDYHATLPGVPDRTFSFVGPLDKTHLWLTEAGDDYFHLPVTHGGLYRVDTRTLDAVPEAPPVHGAFQNVVQVFQINGDSYSVDQDPNNSSTALWRLRSGRWHQFISRLKESGGYYSANPRLPWLSEPAGVWLGVSAGAWWLPQGNQQAVWIDWHRGFLAIGASGLFPLAGGSILDFNGMAQSAEIPPTPQPIRPLPPKVVVGGMGAPKYLGPLMADPKHHLWGTRYYSSKIVPLDEWNGIRWRTHLVPKAIPSVGSLYACDMLGRLWLTTTSWHPPAQPQPIYSYVVYDPARDRWTNYATMQDAYQAAAALPGMRFLPCRNMSQPPVFNGSGEVTYTDNSIVYLYDGKAWRHWVAHDIMPTSASTYVNGPPRFSADGNLEVTSNTDAYEWTSEAGWHRTGVVEQRVNSDPMPLGGPKGLWAMPVVDDLGRDWFTWHGEVYMSWHGLWTKLNALSALGSPFKLGYDIEDVLRDPAGRLFFVSRPTGYYDCVVWTPPASKSPQAPRIQITPLATGSIRLRFIANVPGTHRFLWRLNGGAWSTLQKSDTVALKALPIGNYRVEAQTMDNLLEASPKYSTAMFVIRPASPEQLARWVQTLLSGTEGAREAAIAGLNRQPDAALPLLQAARPNASESGRWWLDAAIQQISPAADQ